jgi:RHS repeat-associated protein
MSVEYDALGRSMSWTSTLVSPPVGVSASVTQTWAYDSLWKGAATSTTRVEDGARYTTGVGAVDAVGRPTQTYVEVANVAGVSPARVPTQLTGRFTTTTTYDAQGYVVSQVLPAVPGMAAETLRYSYSRFGQVEAVQGDYAYLVDTEYTGFGELMFTASAPVPDLATWHYAAHEDGTRRLVATSTWSGSTKVSDVVVSRDQAGNVLALTENASGVAGRQCFRYDSLARLSEAFRVPRGTATSTSGQAAGSAEAASCTTETDATIAAGATGTGTAGVRAPYHLRYAFDPTGNRVRETDVLAGTTWTTAYPAAGTTTSVTATGTGTPGPHSATGVTRDAPDTANDASFAYAYDAVGNVTTRPATVDPITAATTPAGVVAGQQSLTWGPDSRLDRLVTPMSGGTGTVTYDYDPGGAQVLRTDTTPSGATLTTLTLGDTEIARKADGTTTTRRTYQAGLAQVHREVTITSAGALSGTPVLRVLASDHHGTTTVSIDARAVGRDRVGSEDNRVNGLSAGEVSYRFLDPYGDPLPTGSTLSTDKPGVLPGSSAARRAWPAGHGFVAGLSDPDTSTGAVPTGLTQLGARPYAPETGTFAATDPVIDTTNPAQLTGVYAYAWHTPLTASDPTGTIPLEGSRPRSSDHRAATQATNRGVQQQRAQQTRRTNAATSARYTGQARAQTQRSERHRDAAMAARNPVHRGGAGNVLGRQARNFVGGFGGYAYAYPRQVSWIYQYGTLQGWLGQAIGYRPYDQAVRTQIRLRRWWGTDTTTTAYQTGGWAAFALDMIAAGRGATTIARVGSTTERAPAFSRALNAGRYSGPDSAIVGRDLARQLASEQQMAGSGVAIAGAGSSVKLRVAERLAEQYGGSPSDWAKMTSSPYQGLDGLQFETHWYENVATGERYDFKSKFQWLP